MLSNIAYFRRNICVFRVTKKENNNLCCFGGGFLWENNEWEMREKKASLISHFPRKERDFPANFIHSSNHTNILIVLVKVERWEEMMRFYRKGYGNSSTLNFLGKGEKLVVLLMMFLCKVFIGKILKCHCHSKAWNDDAMEHMMCTRWWWMTK